ncbi:UNVERIFIED_CONTAM: hypothetical protein RMT77_013683 [Armadillidium vulgare]
MNPTESLLATPGASAAPSYTVLDLFISETKNKSLIMAMLPPAFESSDTVASVSKNKSSEESLGLDTIMIDLNRVAYLYIMPILISTGVITNLINIYALYDLSQTKDKKQKGSATTYMYLNWLSVSQLLACVSIIPSLMNLNRENLSFGWAFYYAHFEIFSMNSLTSTCVYIVVGLSVDRFVAVCKPHSYSVLSRVRLALFRILASFMLPPVIYTPLCFFQRVEENVNKTGYIPVENTNVADHRFWIFWNIGVEFCHRLIPAVFIVVLNVCIILKFKKMRNVSGKSHGNKSNSSEQNEGGKRQIDSKTSACKTTQEQETKMFALLMGVIIVFLTTTLPAAYLGLTDTFGHKYYSFEFEVFRAVANLLEILGFSLNFLLYFFLVPQVRKKLEALLPKCQK